MDFEGTVYTHGLSWRKRRLLRRFLPNNPIRHSSNPNRLPAGATLLIWGNRDVPGLNESVGVIRLEDGFLRSAGLGAGLVQPLSWVMDKRGIYFDSSRPSDLEWILQNTSFPDELLSRAQALREKIVSSGLTKYNVGHTGWRRPEHATRMILVPGQVESDASLKYGSSDIIINEALLKTVRIDNPGAWIVYKPHPDVVAGLRAPGRGENRADQWCNEIVTNVDMHSLLMQTDEVHVMTSLAGFEGLLRNKKVVCYGLPFYAGWGLTQDKKIVARRSQRLTLNELVAGSLMMYPQYVSRRTGKAIQPEQALQELLDWKNNGGSTAPLWWRYLSKLALHMGMEIK